MASEPFPQCGVVGFVQVAPQNQGTLALGARASDSEHAIHSSARFDAQAK